MPRAYACHAYLEEGDDFILWQLRRRIGEALTEGVKARASAIGTPGLEDILKDLAVLLPLPLRPFDAQSLQVHVYACMHACMHAFSLSASLSVCLCEDMYAGEQVR